MLQRRFRTQYHNGPTTDKPIRTWYNNFEQTGISVLVNEQAGRPSVSDVDVERVREAFTRGLQGHLT